MTTTELGSWVAALAGLDAGVGDAERIDQLRLLEQVKGACAAAQARISVAFADSQRAAQEAEGVPSEQLGRGIGAQVALARRDSAHRGGRHLGLAQALVNELPHTLAALTAGVIGEWRATLVARETACLSADDRRAVDAALASLPGGLPALGDRGTERAARTLAYRIDPHAVVARASKASADRRVTLRPAPDTMSLLTGLLPCAQGVAAYAALTGIADRLRAEGDSRSRGQIMADTLVERVTGQATAEAVPIEVQLVVTDESLYGSNDDVSRPTGAGACGAAEEPAQLLGYGPIPAGLARRLLLPVADQSQGARSDPWDGSDEPHTSHEIERTRVWLRRLYARPADGVLVAMDSRRRIFDDGLRRMLIARDRLCRTPWCGAPIRHVDHVVAHADGGATSIDNGQGLCQACNHAKQASGWRARRPTDGSVVTTTPTGHPYRSHPPPLPGARGAALALTPPEAVPRVDTFTDLELRLKLILDAA
ncbi:MAG: DUF222 domain-containing protein [Nocardioidaceae bacterium]